MSSLGHHPVATGATPGAASPGWPTADVYKEVLQYPQLCLKVKDLKYATIVSDQHGCPLLVPGSFAFVCRAEVFGKQHAIRLFRHAQADRQDRYDAIHTHLQGVSEPFLVGFHYRRNGLQINESRYPLLEMDWVHGDQLDVWLGKRIAAGELDRISDLATSWSALAKRLAGLGIAHGDLQHGNILVEEPGDCLRLVDYDGMFVPALAGREMIEAGYPGYQHPGRRHGAFDANLDHFTALLIYVALRALAAEPGLWRRYQGDNLLFTEADLASPARSKLFAQLALSPAPEVRDLAQELANACLGPFDACRPLASLLRPGSGPVPVIVADQAPPAPALPPPPPVTQCAFGVASAGNGGRAASVAWLLEPGQELPVHTAEIAGLAAETEFAARPGERVRVACIRGGATGPPGEGHTELGDITVVQAGTDHRLRMQLDMITMHEIQLSIVGLPSGRRLGSRLMRTECGHGERSG